MGATNTGSWLNVGGNALTGVSNAIAGGYQSRVASNNAALSDYDAENILDAGKIAEQEQQLKTSQTIGAQKTGFAGNNIDVSSGTAAKVSEDQRSIGDFDAALIRYNAERGAWNAHMEAANYRRDATMKGLQTGFGIVESAGKTYGSYISGSEALANKALLKKQVGING
jgi:hypothetical protein